MDAGNANQSPAQLDSQSTVIVQEHNHNKLKFVIYMAVIAVAVGLIYHFFLNDDLVSKPEAETEVKEMLALLNSDDEMVFEEIKEACQKVPGKFFNGHPVACGYQGTKYWLTKNNDNQFIEKVVDKLVSKEMRVKECLLSKDRSIVCSKNIVYEHAEDGRYILLYKKNLTSHFFLSFDIIPPGIKKEVDPFANSGSKESLALQKLLDEVYEKNHLSDKNSGRYLYGVTYTGVFSVNKKNMVSPDKVWIEQPSSN